MEILKAHQRYKARIAGTFEVFTDLRKAGERMKSIKQIELISGTAFAVGTRWKELRRCAWRDAWMEFVVMEFSSGKSFTMNSEIVHVLWARQFEFMSVSGGTEVSVTMK